MTLFDIQRLMLNIRYFKIWIKIALIDLDPDVDSER